MSLLQGCCSTVFRKWGLKLLLSWFFSLSRISSTLALWRQNPLCPSQRTGCDSEGPSCLCVQMFLFLWSEYRTTGPVFVTLLYSDMINYCVVISQELRAFGNVGGAGHVQLDLCCVQSWWGWERRQLFPCCLLTWLELGQPACSLCSSNVHSSRSFIVTSCVQRTMPSVGCANCTHICY